MAKQRIIHTKIWSDKWFRKLPSEAQRLFLYLLTNEHTNIAGIYELPEDILLTEAQLSAESFGQLIPLLSPKALYLEEWVILPNFIRHQNLRNSKIREGIAILVKELPKEVYELCMTHRCLIYDSSHLNLNLNDNLNLNAPLSGQEEPERPEAEEIRRRRRQLGVKFKVA